MHLPTYAHESQIIERTIVKQLWTSIYISASAPLQLQFQNNTHTLFAKSASIYSFFAILYRVVYYVLHTISCQSSAFHCVNNVKVSIFCLVSVRVWAWVRRLGEMGVLCTFLFASRIPANFNSAQIMLFITFWYSDAFVSKVCWHKHVLLAKYFMKLVIIQVIQRKFDKWSEW